MYNLTRQQAAEKLNISTRSIDRYIKAWKIRAKKIWKIVYVNNEDINILSWENQATTQKVIINTNSQTIKNNTNQENQNIREITNKKDYEKLTITFEKIYSSLRSDIQKKDETIQKLSIKLGRMEEILKNSVNIIDYKKSQFLLEESKNNLNKELVNLKEEKENLTKELKYEKNTNKLLVLFLIILLIIAWLIWFYKI